MENKVTLPPDETTIDRLLDAVEELGPLWRQRMAEHDRTSTFPYENLAEATDAGLNRLTVPVEYGGFGYWMPGNFSGLYRLLERMAYWDTNTAQLIQVHNHAAGIISFHSSPAQRDRFLPQIVDGAYLASLGSEAHLYENGAEALASELTATEGGYRLTARKAFASVAAIAKYLMVWCAVEGDTAYASRMVFAVVPIDAPGVKLLDDWQMLGMRSTVSCSVAFDNVFVPADDVVGEPGGWINNDPRTFSCGYASNHLGTAQGAFDFIAGYVASRDDLSSSEAVKVRLGRMDAQLFAARSASAINGCSLGSRRRPGRMRGRRDPHHAPREERGARHPVSGLRHRGCPRCPRAVPARPDDPRRSHVHAALPRRPLRPAIGRHGDGQGLLGEEGAQRLNTVRPVGRRGVRCTPTRHC